jgi:hypothetical protein
MVTRERSGVSIGVPFRIIQDLGIKLSLAPVNLDKLRRLTGAMLLVTAGTRNVVSCRDVSRHDD